MGALCGCTRNPANSEVRHIVIEAPEIVLLKKSIKKVTRKEEIVDFGVDIFKQLFGEYAYMRDWFPYCNTNPYEIHHDRRMVCHGVGVVKFLQALVEQTHDMESLTAMLELHAAYHLNRAVTAEDMVNFNRVLMEQLKNRWDWKNTSRKRERLWGKFLDLQLKVYRRMEDDWLHASDGTGNAVASVSATL